MVSVLRPGPKSKLSDDMMAEAFERMTMGEPIKAIAIDFKVNVSTLTRRINAAELHGMNCKYYQRIEQIKNDDEN